MKRGVWPIVTKRRARDAMDARRRQTYDAMRTAKSCGPGTPGLVLSPQVTSLRSTVTNKVMDTGESTSISVKTIARGMSMFRLHLW